MHIFPFIYLWVLLYCPHAVIFSIHRKSSAINLLWCVCCLCMDNNSLICVLSLSPSVRVPSVLFLCKNSSEPLHRTTAQTLNWNTFWNKCLTPNREKYITKVFALHLCHVWSCTLTSTSSSDTSPPGAAPSAAGAPSTCVNDALLIQTAY